MGLFSAPSSPSLEGQVGRIFRLLQGYSPEWQERGKNTTGYLDNFMQLMTEQAPAYEQAMLSGLQQTAPEIAALQAQLFGQYAPQYAKTQVDAIRGANPEFYSQRGQLGQELMGNIGLGLTPEQTDYFSRQLNAQSAARGMFDSPLSAVNSAKALTGLDMQARQQNLQNAMGYINNYATINPNLPNIGLPQLGGYQSFGMPSIQDLFSQSAQNRQTKVGGGALYSSIPGMVGAGMGLFGAALGGPLLGLGMGLGSGLSMQGGSAGGGLGNYQIGSGGEMFNMSPYQGG